MNPTGCRGAWHYRPSKGAYPGTLRHYVDTILICLVKVHTTNIDVFKPPRESIEEGYSTTVTDLEVLFDLNG